MFSSWHASPRAPLPVLFSRRWQRVGGSECSASSGCRQAPRAWWRVPNPGAASLAS